MKRASWCTDTPITTKSCPSTSRLGVAPGNGRRGAQVYFNAGTWRRVHRLARSSRSGRAFIAYDVMTYLAFFKDDERKGRPFACWSGALGEGQG